MTVDVREIKDEYSFDFTGATGDMIVGNVIVDDYPVEPVGEPFVGPSGDFATSKWVTLLTGTAGVVSLIRPGDEKEEIGEIVTISLSDVPNPFLQRTPELPAAELIPSERIMPEDTWVYIPTDEPEYDPEIPEDCESYTPEDWSPEDSPTISLDDNEISPPDDSLQYEAPEYSEWNGLLDNTEEYMPPIIKHTPDVIKPGEIVDLYGYFPDRAIDNPLIESQPGDLAQILLGPENPEEMSKDKMISLPTVASSSIDYRCHIPGDLEPGDYRFYEKLADGRILPTDETTSSISLSSSGTPVLKTGEKGKITLSLNTGDANFPENEMMYLELTNFTTNIISFDSGEKFVVPCSLSKGNQTIDLPFTGKMVGQYNVQIEVIRPEKMMEPNEFKSFVSNGFDESYMEQVTEDSMKNIEKEVEKWEGFEE